MKFIGIQVYQTDIIWQPAKPSTLSKSVYKTKTFHLKFFLYIKKLTGNPITNGVGANNNCNFSGYYLNYFNKFLILPALHSSYMWVIKESQETYILRGKSW